MIENLIKIYIFESFTLISCILLGIIASILHLTLLLAVIGMFILLIFIVWTITSRLILKLIIDGTISNEDRRNNNVK